MSPKAHNYLWEITYYKNGLFLNTEGFRSLSVDAVKKHALLYAAGSDEIFIAGDTTLHLVLTDSGWERLTKVGVTTPQ